MTAQQYIDEVKLRLARINVVMNLSDPLILTYVNKARREVQRHTLDILPERYSDIIEIPISQVYYDAGEQIDTYSGKSITVLVVPLPGDMLDVYNVILTWRNNTGEENPDVQHRCEGRRLTKPEMYNIGNHSWNVPTRWRPTYSVERTMNYVSATPTWYLYMSGFDVDTGVSLFDVAHSIFAEVWYVKAIPDIENYNTAGLDEAEFVIPPDIDELVIYNAMMYCLHNIQNLEAIKSVMAELTQAVGAISENYSIEEEKKELLIPSKEGI